MTGLPDGSWTVSEAPAPSSRRRARTRNAVAPAVCRDTPLHAKGTVASVSAAGPPSRKSVTPRAESSRAGCSP